MASALGQRVELLMLKLEVALDQVRNGSKFEGAAFWTTDSNESERVPPALLGCERRCFAEVHLAALADGSGVPSLRD